ncbi:MAG: tetratricopeptide repeat protein, partial [Gemmatimonadetes bacterium]|nr:tetratricopeptide repeat protein [Gemmatimonadota bacterium]NIQ60046.1 tetratricopeptide repeat protein [Gemmatimonadota bacterium]NIU80264.1 tetratricopeptide repeat protein [Gammaproteobacteria bacterium]NIX48646.1 tetratricopeptide repeat protein [Gemmatimonadota bacterium]NIY13087.1 tetratricopeptide repeat protein [Gemmatimonadota bacterium]
MSDAHRDEIAKLEALYAENPEGRIFTHLAEAYRKDGQLTRAHEVLAKGIERHPDYSSAHVVLGRVLMDQGRFDEATTEFHRVLEFDEHNLVALGSLGEIARVQGRDTAAIEYFERLLELDPSSEETKDMLAELRAEKPAAEAA